MKGERTMKTKEALDFENAVVENLKELSKEVADLKARLDGADKASKAEVKMWGED